MQFTYTLQELFSLFEGVRIEGQTEEIICGIASLQQARKGDLSFLQNPKYKKQVASTHASVVLLPNNYEGTPKPNQAFIRAVNPSLSLTQLCRFIERQLWPTPPPGIHPLAFIHEKASVSPTATIGPFCVVEEGAKIGDKVVLQSHVHIGRHVTIGNGSFFMPQVRVLDYCEIGARVRLQSGVVIGSDGYGYELIEGTHLHTPQIGKVIIEDEVEIGANTTIDRARFAATRIGYGTKIDNLVQIAHNVSIGRHCLIVAQVGIAGSTIIEDNVMIGGQVGIAGHVRIGKGSKIGAQSGLSKDLAPDSFVRGSPAQPYFLAHKLEILKRRLPELLSRVDHIEDFLANYSKMHHEPNP